MCPLNFVHVLIDAYDCTVVAPGSDSKRRKSPAAGKGASKKKKQEGDKQGADLVQATVEDVAAAKASQSDAKLVDPNTGDEVHMPLDSKDKQADSSKAAAKPKGKGKKARELVNPNTGVKIDAAATVESKPAAKSTAPRSSANIKDGANDGNQAGPSNSSAKQESQAEQEQYVKINRAPVLTLWVAVVAARQGFSKEAGLTFGKAISGMLAQSKGRYMSV